MKFIFCADNLYIHSHIRLHEVVLFVLLFRSSCFFLSASVSTTSLSSFHQFGLFVCLFHEEFFLSFIFHSLSLAISFFLSPTLPTTLAYFTRARHFTEIPSQTFFFAMRPSVLTATPASVMIFRHSDNTIILRCATFDSHNILFSFPETAPPTKRRKKLDHNLTAIATSEHMKSWIVDMK